MRNALLACARQRACMHRFDCLVIDLGFEYVLPPFQKIRLIFFFWKVKPLERRWYNVLSIEHLLQADGTMFGSPFFFS
jgi:hypothetical protein